ncbi:MAG: ribbon-helix-helix domain-containing protein [Spirochaetaceae bacterium]|jgi:predicted DNA-binding protein|nr:ribbon-helix-helix domain-containing protein [Spirochaetaceae bacterium]
MTSLRLPTDVEQKIFSFAKTRNRTKSAVIIAALEQFFEREEEVDSFELGKDRFGRFGSNSLETSYVAERGAGEYVSRGGGRLSADYKKLVKGKILAKYRSR